jgi:hypothetical protein
MGSGTFATAATYPFDLLRTRFAMQGEIKVLSLLFSHLFFSFENKRNDAVMNRTKIHLTLGCVI